MGDVSMTVPVIRAFVQQYPNVALTVVSRPFFKPFFEGIPNVNFFEADLKNRHKGLLGLYRLYLDLKELEVDAIADLHNVLRSKVVRTFFYSCGIKTAFTDKGRSEKKALTRSKNKIFKPLKTMVERHLDTFQKLGFTVDISQPLFPEKATLTEQIIELSGPKNFNKWIGIAPFAQYESKVYPADLMQEVIDSLAANFNNKIFLFGGGNKETEILNTFAKHKENVIVVAGKISFQEELKLISNLDVMLSMDSGNAHIAAMYGVKVITLWGATHPYAGFAPFNQPESNVLLSDRTLYPLIPTSIYGNKKTAGYGNAMRTILPAAVVEKVERI
jgi:ADP-heptose:LPS heptosyltransferase